MKKKNNINNKNKFLNQDGATCLGGTSALSTDTGIGDIAAGYDVSTGSCGATIDTQSFSTNNSQFPSNFDNSNQLSSNFLTNSAVCNNTCLVKCCGSSGADLSGIAKAISNAAPSLIKALTGGGGTKTATTAKAKPAAATPAKPTNTQAYVIGGVVGIAALVVLGFVISSVIGRRSAAAPSSTQAAAA